MGEMLAEYSVNGIPLHLGVFGSMSPFGIAIGAIILCWAMSIS